jgi:hypothetical protein
VAVVDQKRCVVPERVRVVQGRIADGRPADVGEKGRALQAERLFPVAVAFRSGVDLTDTVGRSAGEAGHAPAVRVREAARVLLALVEQVVLGIQQFAGGTGGMGGLQGVEAAHGKRGGPSAESLDVKSSVPIGSQRPVDQSHFTTVDDPVH